MIVDSPPLSDEIKFLPIIGAMAARGSTGNDYFSCLFIFVVGDRLILFILYSGT
jgi:hypothetical protein